MDASLGIGVGPAKWSSILAEQFIVGMDFNQELVKASKMNMVMNNDGAGGLLQANSLESAATWAPELVKEECHSDIAE